MKKILPKIINIEMFGTQVFLYECSFEDLRPELETKIPLAQLPSGSRGFTCFLFDPIKHKLFFYVWIPNDAEDDAILVHELTHVVTQTLEKLSIKLDNELVAYFLGFLFKKSREKL